MKGAIKNFAIFTEKHRCWSLFLIELQVSYGEESVTCRKVKTFSLKLYLEQLTTMGDLQL